MNQLYNVIDSYSYVLDCPGDFPEIDVALKQITAEMIIQENRHIIKKVSSEDEELEDLVSKINNKLEKIKS